MTWRPHPLRRGGAEVVIWGLWVVIVGDVACAGVIVGSDVVAGHHRQW